MSVVFETSEVTLHHGDCIEVMRAMPDASVDSIVTDPPYGLEFMGRDWDAPWRESDVNADAGFKGEGRVFEKYNAYEDGVELHFQDDGRTLKVFPNLVRDDAEARRDDHAHINDDAWEARKEDRT